MRKLIPNSISVYEQFERRYEFGLLIDRWAMAMLGVACAGSMSGALRVWTFDGTGPRFTTEQLLEHSGVQCEWLGDPPRLVGFVVLDEKQYSWFRLKWE